MGIQGAQRLVEQQDIGIEHQRAHEADALALSARQIARMAAQHLRTAIVRGQPAP